MFRTCWSDQHTQIYQTISMQFIAMFLLYTRLWGPNSNEGHNGTSRLRYVWVWESRRAGLEVLRPPLRQIRPNCCTGSVVCTTRLSIPKCQSNTHHQPHESNPDQPTFKLNAHNNPSQRAQIPTQYICHPDMRLILEIFHLFEHSKHLTLVGRTCNSRPNFAKFSQKFSHRLGLLCSSSISNLLQEG